MKENETEPDERQVEKDEDGSRTDGGDAIDGQRATISHERAPELREQEIGQSEHLASKLADKTRRA